MQSNEANMSAANAMVLFAVSAAAAATADTAAANIQAALSMRQTQGKETQSSRKNAGVVGHAVQDVEMLETGHLRGTLPGADENFSPLYETGASMDFTKLCRHQ